MKDLNNDMDKVFRDKLEDFQQQPPEEIWDGIKAGLGKKPRRKILIPLWQAAAGMALLITAGGALYFLNRAPKEQLAEQFLIVPNNVHPAEKAKSDALISEAYIPASKHNVAEQNKKPSIFGTKEEKLIKEFITSEKIEVIAGNPSEGSYGEKNQDTKKSSWFSPMLMTGSYMQSARKDEIPRNRKSPEASWDMLTASLDAPVENSVENERLLLTAQVSPTYSYRDIGTFGGTNTDQYSQYESGKISYSGGLQFGYKTSERLSIHAGIMYSQFGYNIENVERFNDYASVNATDIVSVAEGKSSIYSVKNSIGTISTTSPETGYFVAANGLPGGDKSNYDNAFTAGSNATLDAGATIEQYFQYLEVPFLMRYKIIDRKFGVNLLGGVSTNILVGNHASLSSGDQTSKIGNSQNIRSFNYMGNMGLGFDYNIRRNLIFTVEPQFKYFLNSINQAQLVANRPYMFGMFTGVRYIW